MPVRWSPHAVTQAMDEIEKLLGQAQVYLDEAKKKAEQARKIPYLPGYMDQHLVGILFDIERFMERGRSDIASVRKDIHEKVLRTEQAVSKGLFD